MLLAHIFDSNYSLLSVYKQKPNTNTEGDARLDSGLGDLRLRWGGALQALWAYLWGLDRPSDSAKGKERARSQAQLPVQVLSGELETSGAERAQLLETTLKILLLACQRSPTNLFIISTKMPFLADFLVTRLYGHTPQRTFAETFPARRQWIERSDDDVFGSDEGQDTALEWTEPRPALRDIYLSLLRKLLEAGVDQKTTWRLFMLVKTTESARRRKDEAVLNSGAVTPTFQPSTRSSTPVPRIRDATPSTNGDETPVKPKKRPNLTIPATTAPPVFEADRLDTEVLDLLKHAMRSRWPDMFVFRGGHDMNEAGIELSDMGRAWPAAQKGFNFSVSVIFAGLVGSSSLCEGMGVRFATDSAIHATPRVAIGKDCIPASDTRKLADQPVKPSTVFDIRDSSGRNRLPRPGRTYRASIMDSFLDQLPQSQVCGPCGSQTVRQWGTRWSHEGGLPYR